MDYFDRNAYLAQSPQFYKQMAMAAGFERIFETGPVFRAEKSYTNKHSTEFSGFDLEFSYITSYKDVMKMEEELLTAGLKAVKEQYGDQIKELFGQEVIVPTTPFPVVKLADLYKALEEEFGYTVDESEKGDLTTEAERLSYDWVKKHYGHEFLFITDYSAILTTKMVSASRSLPGSSPPIRPTPPAIPTPAFVIAQASTRIS